MTTMTRSDATRVHVLTALGLLTLVAVLARLAFYDYSPGSEMFHPHGYCYLWQPDLVAAHVLSDGLIGLSYVAISVTLIYLVGRARHHLPFSWMFVAFGGFIIACGATHFVEIWTLWSPVFWLAADIKIITAVASVATAIVLPPLVPKVLGIVEDARLSEQRRAALEAAREELERRVTERTAELQAALERAQDANRAKEAFLSTVSHELRTPLNAILGWSRMLIRTPGDPAFCERGLTVIDRNARIQAQLVEDLLDVSRMSAGTLRLHLEPLDLERTARDAVEVVRPAADARHVAVQLTAAGEPVTVVGDQRRLQQVTWNLLSNAVKFTPEGGQVRVSVGRAGDTAIIEVADTGIGIDPAFLPRMFDRFSQADPSPTRAHQGLGIGLAIARHLVELHGGTIAVESAGLGRGTTARVALPYRPGVSVAQRDAAAAPGEEPSLDGLRVLVVDDQADARDTMGVILERAGAYVVAADSADAADNRLREGGFDVLVCDVAMPGRDGLALIRDLRRSRDVRLRHLPAVAVSAFAREEDRDQALGAGFHMHVAKPVEPDDLVRAIAAVLPASDR